MRKWLSALMALLLFMACAAACGESIYWPAEVGQSVACEDSTHVGCEVLQMVMMGSFSSLDPEDNLNKRVMSAALSPLCEVSDDAFSHFCEKFAVDGELVHRLYYIALGNCLWADILVSPVSIGNAAAARQILHLFLDPESQPDGPSQIQQIRQSLRAADIGTIAEAAGLPYDFVEYLLLSENWTLPSHTEAPAGSE